MNHLQELIRGLIRNGTRVEIMIVGSGGRNWSYIGRFLDINDDYFTFAPEMEEDSKYNMPLMYILATDMMEVATIAIIEDRPEEAKEDAEAA